MVETYRWGCPSAATQGSTGSRSLSAAFGTRATPPTIDHRALTRVESWIASAEPPAFGQTFPIDQALGARGEPIYRSCCAHCHAQDGRDFSRGRVRPVPPL